VHALEVVDALAENPAPNLLGAKRLLAVPLAPIGQLGAGGIRDQGQIVGRTVRHETLDVRRTEAKEAKLIVVGRLSPNVGVATRASSD
jgi:hypothetical protein